MVLNENEIANMVKECVGRILEVHGAIDDRIKGLAESIIKRLRAGEKNFTIPKEELMKYYPYRNCPESLNVVSEFLRKGVSASYSPTIHTLRVAPRSMMFNDKYLLEIIMHELTHFVNGNEATKPVGHFCKSMETDKEQLIDEILYLFDKSEISARVTQFKQSLSNQWLNRNTEDTTRLKRMLQLINEVEEEDYYEYVECFGMDDSFGTIIEGLLSQRAYYKSSLDGKERFSEMLSEDEFNAAKNAILKTLKKRYKAFKAAIDKNIYDYSSESSTEA